MSMIVPELKTANYLITYADLSYHRLLTYIITSNNIFLSRANYDKAKFLTFNLNLLIYL